MNSSSVARAEAVRVDSTNVSADSTPGSTAAVSGGSGPIASSTSQLLVVTSDAWPSRRGQLQRYERDSARPWHAFAAAIHVVLGYAGYAWGDGLHGQGAPPGRAGPLKREGDGRSPAGVFALGSVHGYAATLDTRLPYQVATDDTRCVDDPASRNYNRIIAAAGVARDFASAERMHRDDDLYELAIDVEHNRNPVVPGHGSCIFLHVWAGPDVPVSGCTGMAKSDLQLLLRWLQPSAAVLVALPAAEYAALRQAWGLP
jgi:D-alanyl-D-alanine dipeptidase